MKLNLAYGKGGLDLSLPDGLNVDVIQPQQVEAPADQTGAVRDALRNPIGSRPLRDLVGPSDTVAVVCNDATRPTPYRTILPALLDELSHVRDSDIVLLIATGTHRACMPDELEAMLGRQIVQRFRIVQNDAYDRDTHLLDHLGLPSLDNMQDGAVEGPCVRPGVPLPPRRRPTILRP